MFGDDAYALSMSSTKSAIGHLLGAAGSVEAIFSIMAVNGGVVPPTLNLDNPSEGCDLDLVPKRARERPVRNALSNSFGFGGTNASLIFAAPPDPAAAPMFRLVLHAAAFGLLGAGLSCSSSPGARISLSPCRGRSPPPRRWVIEKGAGVQRLRRRSMRAGSSATGSCSPPAPG